MTKSLWMILLGAAALCAQDSTPQVRATTTKTTKPAKTTPVREPKAVSMAASSIPKNAESLGNGKYRSVDPSGEAWIYQETPFGITKTLESATKADPSQVSPFGVMKTTAPSANTSAGTGSALNSAFAGGGKSSPAASAPAQPPASGVTAFPVGNEIRFEKPTPFGKSVWTKKRTDSLTQLEKDALAAAEKNTASSGKN